MRGEQLLELARRRRQAVLRFEVAVVKRQQVAAQIEFGDRGAGAARRADRHGEQAAVAGFLAGTAAQGEKANRHGGLRDSKAAILPRFAAIQRRGSSCGRKSKSSTSAASPSANSSVPASRTRAPSPAAMGMPLTCSEPRATWM